ncbi:hypothetical protein [Streptomyces sp. NBC_01320]|uniref:hypothetical protein n=1 Tax=Streptomyces sp. NBC_01320 TaxID=2903824 RepID=UPI002E0E49AC|nr:hypothetical protein OG395_10485 [Streptomyces sp. NBC_01320]
MIRQRGRVGEVPGSKYAVLGGAHCDPAAVQVKWDEAGHRRRTLVRRGGTAGEAGGEVMDTNGA